MSYADLVHFAQRHRLSPTVLTELSQLVSDIVMAPLSRLRDALRATQTPLTPTEVEDTLIALLHETAESVVISPLENHALGEPTPPVDTSVTERSTEAMAEASIDAGGTLDSLFMMVHPDHREEGPIDEPPDGTLVTSASRYEDLGLLGVGGMGEVRRVKERDLNRTLAMKIIKPEMMASPASQARFVEEAQVSAQLQHPSIIPVHEMGRMPDGRYYFTMQEIRGRQFSQAIASVHAASAGGRWNYDSDGWGLRRLISALQKASQAVGYAHARGVIHRDLKPSNIMVGGDGEVFVVDWGIAKIKAELSLANDDVEAASDQAAVETNRSSDNSWVTRMGAVTGTPAYMSPEQAEGNQDEISARSDVYSLGAILYEILTGRVPYEGTHVWATLVAVIKAKLRVPSEIGTKKIPPELEEICIKALSADPDERYTSARELAVELRASLDGAQRRERALALVRSAQDATDEGRDMLRRAKVMRRDGEAYLKTVPGWAKEDDKHTGWLLEDQASELEQNARIKRMEATQSLHAALTYAPDLPEAHHALAEHHRERHQQAESSRDATRARGEEILLRSHVGALPIGEKRQAWINYLNGEGALTLITSPPGASVKLYRMVQKNRRLTHVLVQALGSTPLVNIPLGMGSYLLEIHKEGHELVRYPVFIERNQHWDGVSPDGTEPHAITLPRRGALGSDECYVPAGWFWAGGDPDAYDSWPRRRYWVDAFIMQQFSVTNRDYIEFLDDLVEQGREEDALRHAPQERSGTVGEKGAQIYGRTSQGHFELRPDADGDVWLLDFPVCMIDWYAAEAYAAWRAARDGIAWRLPMEHEWAKAARGVDGRFFPWGDYLDPSWCAMTKSHKGRPTPSVIDSYPIDISVYGIRGLGGNMRDWGQDHYHPEALPSGRVDAAHHHGSGPRRISRGGAWSSSVFNCRLSARGGHTPVSRYAFIGLRLCRSYDDPQGL